MASAILHKDPQTVVLYTNSLWESPMVRLRVLGPAEQAGLQVIQGNHFSQVFPERVSSADLVVIQRDFPRYEADCARVMAQARAEGKPVVYETDDLLIDLPEDHSHIEDYSGILLPMARAALQADAVTASTRPLADYFRSLNPNTWVSPNYLNDQIWSFRNPPEPREQNFPLTIGYMGGETHAADVRAIAPALLAVLSRYAGQVGLRFWGGKPPEDLLSQPHVEWVPLNELDYAKFAAFFMQQSCDLWIAPLRDNLFNRAKSALKFLEYSTLGVPGVFSRLPAYGTIVEHGVNGFLAYSQEDWEGCLVELIEAPGLRYSMGLKAQEQVRKAWLLSQHRGEWLETVRQALAPENPLRTSEEQKTGLLRLIERMEQRHTDMRASIEALNAQVIGAREQLDEVLNSRSWRTLQKLQRARLWLAPRASRRERILKSLRILG